MKRPFPMPVPFLYYAKTSTTFCGRLEVDDPTTTSPTTAPPTVISSPTPTTPTPTNNNSTGPCVTDIANAWVQPKFCARTYKSGLQRPRGLHIDQETNEILMVERFGGYGIWDSRARVVRFDESESGR